MVKPSHLMSALQARRGSPYPPSNWDPWDVYGPAVRKGQLRSREATTRTDFCHADFRVSGRRIILKEGGEISL